MSSEDAQPTRTSLWRRRSGPTRGDDPLATKNDLIRLARVVRWLVRGAAFVLALAFGWLKLRGVDLGPLTKDLSADVVVQIALTLYYFCWVGGLLSDTSDQELVYVRAPSRPHVLFGGAVNAALLTAVFAVLCYVDTYRKFAVFLASFLVLNVIGWIYLIRVVLPPTVRSSEEYYLRERKYPDLEQLRVVYRDYLCGAWQWARFAAGGVIVLVINLLSFSRVPPFLESISAALPPDLMISVAILAFVLVMEIWIWLMRLRVKSGLRLLKGLSEDYRFVRNGSA